MLFVRAIFGAVNTPRIMGEKLGTNSTLVTAKMLMPAVALCKLLEKQCYALYTNEHTDSIAAPFAIAA